MVQRNANYYDVIAYGLGGNSFQSFVDGFKAKYNALNVDGFEWDKQIQIDFTYEQLDAELGVATLPTYVDYDSPGPLKGYGEATIGSNKIARFKHGFVMDEKLIREQIIMMQRFKEAAMTTQAQNAMRDLLFDSVDKLIAGNHNELTHQRMQIVSTGKFTIDATNNPEGIKGLTFDFGIPTANKTSLSGTARWWTNAEHTTEGSASDPLKFMKDLRKQATRQGNPSGHFEISQTLFDDMVGHSKVLSKIGYALYPVASSADVATAYAQNLTDEAIKNAIEKIVGAPLIIRDSVSYVDEYNKETGRVEKRMVENFDVHNIAYIPNGNLGTIKAVEPIAVADPGARIALFDGGRTLIKQTYNSNTNTQYIQSECTALVVPNVRRYMYIATVTA